MIDFSSRMSIEAWALERSVDEISVLAALDAANHWPFSSPDFAWQGRETELLCARAVMTALVRGKYDTHEIRRAAMAAREGMIDGTAGSKSKDAIVVASLRSGESLARVCSIFAYNQFDDAVVEKSLKAQRLINLGIERTMEFPLWETSQPQLFMDGWSRLKSTRLFDPAIWGFWVDWYEGLLEGRTPDWDLWHDIVLIPNDVWDAGPEAVARAIEGVKVKRRSPDIPPETITAQAKALIAKPETTELITSNVADQIDDAITEYMRAANTNTVPEAFERLRGIPPLLRGIGQSSQSADRIAELEQQVRDLIAETVSLARDIESLQADLTAKKPSGASKVFVDQCAKTSATLLTTSLFGVIVMGLSHTTSHIDFGSALETLSGFGKEVDEIVKALPTAVDT